MNTDRLYYKRKIAGLCPECGAEIDDKKFKLCSGCRKIARLLYKIKKSSQTQEEREAYNKKRLDKVHALRAKGLCVDCGAPSPEHWRCDACNKRLREKYQQEADMLREAMEEEQW